MLIAGSGHDLFAFCPLAAVLAVARCGGGPEKEFMRIQHLTATRPRNSYVLCGWFMHGSISCRLWLNMSVQGSCQINTRPAGTSVSEAMRPLSDVKDLPLGGLQHLKPTKTVHDAVFRFGLQLCTAVSTKL